MLINFMEMVRTFVAGLTKDENGQAMVEYGLILALVSVVALGTLALIGTNVGAAFTAVETAITAAL
jgi:pilus assembly protein Flp/PilA